MYEMITMSKETAQKREFRDITEGTADRRDHDAVLYKMDDQ